jgi:Fe-S cluster assembly protein SufD
MTTQLIEGEDMFRAAFEQVQRDGTKAHALRSQAFTRFSEVGLPTPRLESWRFTNVRPIGQRRFVMPAGREVDPSAIASFELRGLEGPRAIAIDGRYVPELSSIKAIPPGVAIQSLTETLASGQELLTWPLGQLATFDDPAAAFTALNTSLFQDGIVVSIPDNTVVEAPLHLLFAATGSSGVMSHPRVLVVVGENSQLRLVESYAGVTDGAYLTNAVTEIVVGDNAVVDHYKLVRESVEAYHIASMHVRIGRSANFSSHAITLGGAIVRNDVVGELDGEGAECTLNGLYLVNDTRLVDNHTTIYHTKPHCNSHALYKGILDDRARAVFNGKIVVAPDAQKTDAKQTNKALLLSEDAQINTKPELEIFADDVKCTHGATIGQLDADALFYLRSRGLDVEQARSVLIHAFASDLLNRIAIEPIRAEFDAVLLRQLPGSGHTTFTVA